MKHYKHTFLFFIVMAFLSCSEEKENKGSARIVEDFNKDWKFRLGDHPEILTDSLATSDWRVLNVPHDWSIEGEFSEDHPTKPEGGALPAGIAWYQKQFNVPEDWNTKLITVEFDGVYRNSSVYVNGQLLGTRPYGYSSFSYDITPHIEVGKTNTISVKVDNSLQPNSRWYTGSGIYRNVRLLALNKVHVPQWGTFVTTPEVSKDLAVVNYEISVANAANDNSNVRVVSKIVNSELLEIATISTDTLIPANHSIKISKSFELETPKLWTIDQPNLYKVVSQIYVADTLTDTFETPFGIRYFKFHPEKGFSLNGESMKLLGVCLHHDLGALGAAINTAAIKRRLKILKNMGANAIRTAHNPPSPELLQLCDEMGFLVQDEAFDAWKKKKATQDYHISWDEWHERDLKDMVRRDRNHPSIIMWSIGNEIREQFDSTGIEMTKSLVRMVKDVDTTRPVTCALTENIPEKNYIYQSKALDLLGFNYKHEAYEDFSERFKGESVISSESMSALATRGDYDLPSNIRKNWPPAHNQAFDGNDDFSVSSYDMVSAYWGSTHEETWKTVKKLDAIAGLFVWTGFDYLGEPIPYPFPARSSYFGIIDLAGFPKDVYYMYQSEWTDKDVLHVFPHWNWEQGQEVDVWVYYNNADSVELFLNGKSLGSKSKQGEDLHISWNVAFEPGTITAVSTKDGKVVKEQQVSTAGKANSIKLSADREGFNSDGQDMVFVTVDVIDEEGRLVPRADNLIDFKISGGGKIVGVDNGYPASMESFKVDYRKAYNGKCLVMIQSNGKDVPIELTASSEGIDSATLKINTID